MQTGMPVQAKMFPTNNQAVENSHVLRDSKFADVRRGMLIRMSVTCSMKLVGRHAVP